MIFSRRTFLASSLALAADAEIPDDWQGVKKVVSVGDIHGDKDAFAKVLKISGLINEEEQWIGGAAHLVQIGDVPARGPQTRSVFDFLMRLEKEAASAGGRVHSLIGNHDAGLLYGEHRGTLPAEFEAFKEPDSEEKLQKLYAAELLALTKAGRLPADPTEQEYRKKAWFDSHPPGFVEHSVAFSPTGDYGSWIRRNNAVIRINDTLYLHGGISPKYVRHTRAALNTTIRRELADPARLIPGMTSDVQGPLWYRGLAQEEPAKIEVHLQAVLRFHGVRRIVIGHTVTQSAILPRLGGRVINIDLGLSRFYGRPPACLVQEGATAYVLHNKAKIPLPAPGAGPFLAYLKAVEAADEQPSPLTQIILDGKLRP